MLKWLLVQQEIFGLFSLAFGVASVELLLFP